MLILVQDTDYNVLICRACQIGVSYLSLEAHLLASHRNLSSQRRRELLHSAATFPGNPRILTCDDFQYPVTPRDVFQDVQYFRDGMRCLRCESTTVAPYIARSRTAMHRHLHVTHGWVNPRKCGRYSGSQTQLPQEWQSNITCQRLFLTGRQSGFFEVSLPPEQIAADAARNAAANPPPSPPPTTYEGQIRHEVSSRLDAWTIEHPIDHTLGAAHFSEVNPWLETTKWKSHLRGLNLRLLPRLIAAPGDDEPICETVALGLDRIIQNARQSVLTDKVNIFDQTVINLFRNQQTKVGSPLVTTIRDNTYYRYKMIWKKLLAFLIRIYITDDREFGKTLPCRLTSVQQGHLQQTIRLTRLINTTKFVGARLEELQEKHDNQLLDFCISLLQHTIRANLQESVIIVYLAILGIHSKEVGLGTILVV